MTTLTIEFKGITETILDSLIARGYAKTKAEAVRYALLHVGQEMSLTHTKFHERAEEYAYEEIKGRFDRTFKRK